MGDVGRRCAFLEQIYVSFAIVLISTLIAICKDKPLVVLDACDMAVDINIHCKRILDNTQGHIVHMTVSFQCSKLNSEFENVYQKTTIRLIYIDL